MSDPGTESMRDLAAAYALGALAPEESRRFETYLAGSPQTQHEVAEYREVAALLALAQSDAVPDQALRRRVLERIAADKPRTLPGGHAAAREGRGPLVWSALAASLVSAVALGALLLATRNELAGLRQDLAAVTTRLAEREATLNAIFEPGVQMFQLTSSGDPDPGIQLFWDRQRHLAILHGYQLRQVPAGQAYQLWFIKDGAPVPSVTFRPEPDGHVKVERVAVPEAGTLSAAAVTVEPEAGSSQPTSPIVLVGQLRKS